MPEVALANDEGTVVCEHCLLAETMFARLRGLLGRSGLSSGEGMLLRPAASIHTAFMRFPIDAVFLDRESRVLKVAAELPHGGPRPAGDRARCWSSRPAKPPGRACAPASR